MEGTWYKVYHTYCTVQATLPLLAHFDPAAAQALRKLEGSTSAELQALLSLDGLPGDMTVEAYIDKAVQRILVEEVKWQSQSFAQVCWLSFSSATDCCAVAVLLVW